MSSEPNHNTNKKIIKLNKETERSNKKEKKTKTNT